MFDSKNRWVLNSLTKKLFLLSETLFLLDSNNNSDSKN